MKAFDPLGALRRFVENDVDFILIGGLAARLHGSPTVTGDLDVCHDQSRPNLERLASALVEMDAALRLADTEERVEVLLDDRFLAATQHLTLTTDFGFVDLLAHPAGTDGYDDLIRSAAGVKLGRGLVVQVASIDDLIRMKWASGRPKDLIEVEVLTALQDEVE